MKNKRLLVGVGLLSTSLILVGCRNTSEKQSSNSSTPTIYSTKIKSITTDDDGNFIVKGKTNAPKGSKLFAQSSDDSSSDTNQISSEDVDWAKVKKNGTFKGEVNAADIIPGKEKNDYQPTVGEKGKVKIFAATKVKDSVDSTDIPKKVRHALKNQNISYTEFTADEKIKSYYKDDSSSTSSKSSSSSSDSSSTDSSSVDTSEDYQPISYDDLARHPKANLNKPIEISGTILQVHKEDGEYLILMYMDDNPDETVMVVVDKSDKPSGEILEDDQITIKGNAGGKQSYETVLGEDREIPYVDCNEKVIDNGKASE